MLLSSLETTSYSQQKTILRCPKKFEYQYVRKLKPKKTEARFLLGRAVHTFLEHYYRCQVSNPDKDKAFEAGFKAFEEYVQQNFPQDDESFEQADLAEGMIRHYHRWAIKEDDFVVLEAEIPFELKLDEHTTHRGVIDVLVQNGDGLWIMEHKTASQINTSHTLLDQQISTYVMACKQFDIDLKGVIYNTLRKAVPKKPKVLKSGQLSRSLDNNITYESYLEAIQELGQDPSEYQDVLNELQNRPNTFFHREYVVRTDHAIQEAWKDIQKAEALKQALVGANVFPRNATRDCTWDCPYYELCLAELEGNDVEMLLAEKFVID